MEGSKNLFGKIEGEAKDSNSKIKDLFCKISNKWKKFLERTAERFRQYKEKFGIKRNEQMKEKNDLVTQENGSKENTPPIKDFFNKFKSGMKKIMVWIWKFLLVLVNIPIFCLNAIMIFLFGTSVVLTMKGYGSFGIVVALLGSIILISSFSILLILMCKEIKKFYIWTLLPLGIGILLIGVGVGTSFIQFSSFTYGGTVLVNEDNIICEEFSFTIDRKSVV